MPDLSGPGGRLSADAADAHSLPLRQPHAPGGGGPSIHLVDPLCVPAAFAEAERRYMRFAADDYTAWLSCCREATLFRESDLVGEQQRLRSTIYQECYQPFEVYDSLQYGIVCNGQPLGALSLFRCREDGPFSDHELFLLRSVGTHLNQQMAALLAGTPLRAGP